MLNIQANDASIKGLFNVFTGSSGQNPNQSQEFHHLQVLLLVTFALSLSLSLKPRFEFQNYE